jgi:Xaa-Pro aminopeptidase
MKNFIKLLKKYKIDGYIVPKNDEYFNEFASPSNDRLKFISNFSGSAGFAIILKNKNYLFVDGRYTIQARYQSGKKFRVITIPNKFPKDVFKSNKKIVFGFDPKLHTEKQLNYLFKIKNVKLKSIKQNLVDKVWLNKPKSLVKPFFLISPKNAGATVTQKIRQVKSILSKNKVDYLLVTAPENVAWILNIRGHDSYYSPVPNARLLISKSGDISIFANPKKFTKIKKIKVFTHDEKELEKILSQLSSKKIWLDSFSCSFYYKSLFMGKNKIIEKIDPIYFFKSIKNNTEIQNMKKSHLIDGVALTKFLFWLKKNFKKKKITEISAQKKLESFRKIHPTYKYPSFNTISGSGPNSAIIHYKASSKTNRALKKGELYLVDSGGQYSFGTTDVTRTVSLENKSDYIKEIYTRVLKGHIAVSNFPIKNKTTGSQVDRDARRYLKKINLDYPHGTGHGVGYFLNVHEGPQSISKNNRINLKNGMILSNEPGYYKKGSFGIRIENLVYIKNKKFQELTLAPIEKSLIKKDVLNINEIKWINQYHNKVKKSLFPFMNVKEKIDLIKACSPIK